MYSDHSSCPLQGGHQISAASLDQRPLRHLIVGNPHNITSTLGQRIFMVQSVLLSDNICIAKNCHVIQINIVKATGLMRQMGLAILKTLVRGILDKKKQESN